MIEVKTVHTDGKVVSVEGRIKLLSEKGLIRKVEVWMLNDAMTRNDWRYVNIKEHMAEFADIPLLISYKNGQLGAGHEMDEVHNTDGTVTQSFMSAEAERIIGRTSGVDKLRIETVDGYNWVVGEAKLWSFYCPEVVKKLDKLGGKFAVSVETLVDEYITNEDGTETFTKYRLLGVTLLGEGVTEACAGANLKTLSLLGKDNLNEMTKLRVASAKTEYETIKKSATQKTKGEKTKMGKFNKAELNKMFDGYTVLASNGLNVALLNSNGEFCSYTFAEDETEADVAKIINCSARTSVGEGDNAVEVNTEAITGAIKASLNSTKSALDTATQTIAELNATITAMNEAEKVRRIEAVKAAIKNELEINNANLEECEKVDSAICDDMLTDECLEAYSEAMCNSEWVGERNARRDVDARCMAELRKSSAMKSNASQKKHAWDIEGVKNNDASVSFIDKAIANTIK